MNTPKIVPVPEKMQRFYGSGSMLHPDLQMVKDLICQIPKGKVTTIGMLGEKLAKDFGAHVTCPMRTGNHLKRLSKSHPTIPFWRVIKNDAKMIQFENLEHWASILEKEGHHLRFTISEKIRVNVQGQDFFQFD